MKERENLIPAESVDLPKISILALKRSVIQMRTSPMVTNCPLNAADLLKQMNVYHTIYVDLECEEPNATHRQNAIPKHYKIQTTMLMLEHYLHTPTCGGKYCLYSTNRFLTTNQWSFDVKA